MYGTHGRKHILQYHFKALQSSTFLHLRNNKNKKINYSYISVNKTYLQLYNRDYDILSILLVLLFLM